MAPLDADNARISFDPADQYSVAPSTANISVTYDSRDSFMSDAVLTGRIWLRTRLKTITSSENKASYENNSREYH